MYNKNVLKSINLNNKVKKMRKFLIVSFLITFDVFFPETLIISTPEIPDPDERA